MKIVNQRLLIDQLDRKLLVFKGLKNTPIPLGGWIHTIRTTLKMSLRQLGSRLKIVSQSAKEIEEREANGTITLNSLREAGKALNMKLVYGFIPNDESIEKMIEKRSLEIATEIVSRTSQTMKLEDQENSSERISQAVKSRAIEIQSKLPKYLWD